MSTLPEFEEKIGYQFQTKSLLSKALTHTSAGKRGGEFERLEFLGDRVLGIIVADILYRRFPQEKEGDLAKRLANMVRRETCEAVAFDVGIDTLLSTAPHQSIQNTSMMSDACEALIGALYLDGGLSAAQLFIEKYWNGLLDQNQTPPKDGKTQAQEWAQSRGLPVPIYQVVERTGPDHAPFFRVQIIIQGCEPIEGEGPNKRIAEQDAAQRFLDVNM